MLQYRWLALKFVLLVLAVSWCAEAFLRRREDFAQLRQSRDRAVRPMLIGYWIFTAAVLAWLIAFGPGIAMDGVRSLAP